MKTLKISNLIIKSLTCFLLIMMISSCKTQSIAQKNTHADKKSPKNASDKHIPYPKQKITASKMIWGSYILTTEDIKVLENQKLSKSTIQNIVSFSHQSTWPLSLQNMAQAKNSNEVFALYNSYLIAPEIDEPGLEIYYIPFAQNSQMPDSLLLDKEDFYVIVKK